MPEPEYKVRLKMSSLLKRREEISRILEPLVARKDAIYVYNTGRSNTEIVWAVVAKGENTQGAYESKKFPVTDSLQGSYYERWQRYYVGRDEYWYLERAYLHFYKLNEETANYDEYLLLHCDPNEDREHALYKDPMHNSWQASGKDGKPVF